MSLGASVTRLLLLLVAVSPFFVTMAFAQGLHCEDVWKGPSADNDVVTCMTSTSRAQNNFSYFVPFAIAILVFIFFFLLFPICFMWCTCCKCCCACCKDVPVGERESSKKSRLRLVVVICVGLVLAIVALAVLLSGAPKVSSGADGVFVNLHKHVLTYFIEVIDTMVDKVKDPKSGNLTEPFSNDTVSMAKGYVFDIGNATMKYRTDATNYADLATKVGYGVAVFPLVLIAFTVLFSCCNCRFCLPSCFSCVYYLFFFLFSLLAIILLIIAPIMGALSAEIDLQESRKPGVFQWYVIPYCEKQANFTSLKQQIADMELSLAQDVCEKVSKYCSPSLYFNSSEDDRKFYCNMTNETKATDCASFKMTLQVLNNSWVKDGANPCNGMNCTLLQCGDNCTDPTIHDAAADATVMVLKAGRLFDALRFLTPLMDCNVLSDRLLMMLKSMPEMSEGLWMLGAAFLITQVMLVVGAVIMFFGAKLWFSEKEYEDDTLEAEVDHEMASQKATVEKLPA